MTGPTGGDRPGGPGDGGRPEVRIGDAERTAAMEALGEHLRAGRLDPHEYDERVEAVAAARTRSAIDPLFTDLPAPHPPWAVAPAPTPPAVDLSKGDRAPATPPGTSGGPLFGRVGATIVAASPFVALLLFVVTGYQWWWWLLVPLAGALVYGGGDQGRDRGRDRRRPRDR